MQRQGWRVEQVSVVTGVWSLNEEELKKNLAYFKVPSTSVETIHAKLAMKIFDEYVSTQLTEDPTTQGGRTKGEGIINLRSITFIDNPFKRIVSIPLPNHQHSCKEH